MVVLAAALTLGGLATVSTGGARGGRFSAGGGYGAAPDETFLACTVGGRHYSPAS